MRPVRKIALIVVSIVVALVVVLATIPLFFGDKIAARLKAQVDESVNARVAWSGIGVSLLRDFPNVTASVNDLRVAGVQRFARDTLVTMDQAKLVLDLGSVVGYLRSGKPIVVREITIEKPVVHLKRLADGTANWDIAKSKDTAAASSSNDVHVTLRSLAIHDGVLTMDDTQGQLTASVHGLDEALSGDFATQKFVLTTRTSIDSLSVRFAGVPYLNRVALMLHANVDADIDAHRFTLKDDSLRLNKLLVTADGSITTGSPNLGLDLKFAAPSTAFADILSLVPAIYAKDFAKLQTSGTMALNGQVKGAYGPKAFPALALRARVDNGTFRYPDLPLGARDIGLELAIDNPGGHVDSTVVDLKKFHALIGDRPLDAKLFVRTPVSDPDADVRIAGSVNLGDIAKTVKLEGVTQLSGIVAADVATHARVSDVNAKRYDRVSASGAIQASRITMQSSAVPYPIAIDTAALTLSPRSAALTAFSAKIGGSDARATGSLDNLLGFVLHNEDLRGTATVSSNRFVLDEWKSNEKTTEVIPVPPRIDFGLAASAKEVTYGPLKVANVAGNLQVKDQRVTMRDLKMDMLKGAVVANGFYDTADPAKPAFGMDVKMTTLDIPTAFASLITVQKLTPIAKWAQGNVSGTLALNGTLGSDMMPVFSALTGKGEIATQRLVLSNAPVLTKLSSALSMDALN
ncbi:MAG TPA: AsmA family protein, partial [Gemmatimonadaceae bacterium]